MAEIKNKSETVMVELKNKSRTVWTEIQKNRKGIAPAGSRQE